MARQRHTPEQIIAKLRQAEIELSKGKDTTEVCRLIGVHEQTYYRWRKEFGGMAVDQVKRLREIEKENAQLKKIVADQAVEWLGKSSPVFLAV